MKTIYSSKLYIASSRKSRINAALVAPGNLSLVQQLASDLDDEYRTPSNLGQTDSNEGSDADKGENKNNLIVDEKIDPEKDLMTVDDLAGNRSNKSVNKPANIGPKHKSSEPNNETKETSDTSDLIPESPANEKPQSNSEEKPVEESTQIKSTTIVKPEEKVNIEVLKGSLNGRSDTCGVSRIVEKDNKEIWIYYNDGVNLNDIMTNVIEYVLNAGFPAMEFNRLARSDNAIVFELVRQTTSIPNKQIGSQPLDTNAIGLNQEG